MVLAAMAFNDDVQLNPDLSINRNGRMRKRKRINNWQAEDDEKMKSLYIQHGIQFSMMRDSGVMLRCSLLMQGFGVRVCLSELFLKVKLGLNVR